MKTGKDLIREINECSGSLENLAFWWLGQASVILKMAGKVIYIDPYLSPHPERRFPPLIKPEEVSHADLVLCTHDHGDHIDPGAIPGIATASPHAIFVVPRAAKQRILDLGVLPNQLVGMNDGETYQHENLIITAIKAKHEFFDQTPDGSYPYLGFVIQSGNLSVYHSGDTLVYDGLLTSLKAYQFTTVFLPINGRDATRFRAGCLGNMTFQEAVDLGGELQPRLVVPIHYDMFDNNCEDPQRFVDYLTAKYPAIKYWVGACGEKVEVAEILEIKQ